MSARVPSTPPYTQLTDEVEYVGSTQIVTPPPPARSLSEPPRAPSRRGGEFDELAVTSQKFDDINKRARLLRDEDDVEDLMHRSRELNMQYTPGQVLDDDAPVTTTSGGDKRHDAKHEFSDQKKTDVGRAWVFTFNKGAHPEMVETVLELLKTAPHAQYCAASYEVGDTTFRPHIHAYLYTTKNVRRLAISRHCALLKPWFEQSGGSAAQATDYFRYADGHRDENGAWIHNDILNPTFLQFGEFPNAVAAKAAGQAKGGKKTKAIWDEVKNHIASGGDVLSTQSSQILILHYGNLSKLSYAYRMRAVPRWVEMNNLWITGPTGSGKTRWVAENYPGAYIKNASNKWFDGYEFEDVVSIEDVGRGYPTSSELKVWGDHYRFNAEYKGGSVCIRPSRVIITSNYTIAELYPDPQDLPALLRRFRVVHVVDGKLVDVPASITVGGVNSAWKATTFTMPDSFV